MPKDQQVQTQDGRWFMRRTLPYRTRDNRIEGVVVTFHDVTELKHAEQAVRRTVERLELLAEVSSQLLASDRPQEIVDSLCRRVMEHLDCQVFFNYLLDEQQNKLRLNSVRRRRGRRPPARSSGSNTVRKSAAARPAIPRAWRPSTSKPPSNRGRNWSASSASGLTPAVRC